MKTLKKSIALSITSMLIILFSAQTQAIDAKHTINEPFGFHPALVAARGYKDSGYYDAQNIGVCWTRPSVYAFWFIIQPNLEKDEYDFRLFDRLYGDVPEGMNIIANITADSTNLEKREENRESYFKENSYEPIDIEKYKKFVQATVERYDGDGVDDMKGLTNPVLYWQVDNEPPRKRKDFAILQSVTYDAIKMACPECKVLIGGATGFPDDFDANFMMYSKILEDLDGKGFDIFDFHWYGNAFGDYRKMGKSLDLIKSTLGKNGFGDVPIWITEMGSYSGKPANMGRMELPEQSEQIHATDMFKRFIYPLSVGIEKVFPAFGLIEGFRHDDGYFDHCGLIYNGQESDDLGLGVKKLAYWTYKLMTEKLTGLDWNSLTECYQKDHLYVYEITKGDEPVWIAWLDWFEYSKNPPEVDANIKLQFDKFKNVNTVKITEVVPNFDRGIDIKGEYSDIFKQTTCQVKDGGVEFNIGINPVIIEIEEIATGDEVLVFKVGEGTFKHNEETISMDAAPVILENRTYLPARYVVEPLGGTVEWDEVERKIICKLAASENSTDESTSEMTSPLFIDIQNPFQTNSIVYDCGYLSGHDLANISTIETPYNIVELWIGKPIAKVNGVETQIDPDNSEVVPTIIDGRTMVPMRFLAESLGCSVE
ncbi:MAG TPA: copper amine oxidase N-terminal domain-containing protein [Caldisericia bacterium]|nr:copper amine oxidase N-terminal domain-containing protein [Caldisericia bacterium]HPF48956.1 copper amine oxidase N-terminal domain-containing protein [Caldisericia bacterium]HPI83180.1 copper amine oxidase N-terminal domain-containing protein [Caldisericia bacterium]HPQ92407.1 copper amine oxidase N-terminal domain-containing protein [Caldisericia bacterium]HRV74495.1 copper amine oxidase N-terminal domain-containing protein [Caldisericia bacterium]